jgi:hypothetical protein
MVHEQKNIGVYEISVLSAKGVDGLYDWLKENNYPVKQNEKEVLNWYVDKEWYFTAVRISPEGLVKNIISEFDNNVSTKVTKDNLAEELTDYFVDSIKERDFKKFKKTFNYLAELNSDFVKEAPDVNEWSEEDFINEIVDNVSLEEVKEEKEEMKENIQKLIDEIYSNNIDKYDGYIKPIKISFQTESIIYPLKISRISTKVPKKESESPKTNEVLLYVLADDQVKAPNFENEFAQSLNREKLRSFEESAYNRKELDGLEKIVGGKNLFLTKLRRKFAKAEMDEDLYLIKGQSRKKIDNSELIPLTESYKNDQTYQEAIDKIKGSALSDRLKGKIVIKTEDQGKAYYINSATKYSHYLGRPADAFNVMRDQGVGVTNQSLNKIPIAVSNLSGNDSDGDGLTDIFEGAVGTDKNSADTDEDGYNDREEIRNQYNPKGQGKLNINQDFIEKQKGKILLQIERNGEAWYVNPEDGKRYFLGRPDDAFQVMKDLGLGISNEDFGKL